MRARVLGGVRPTTWPTTFPQIVQYHVHPRQVSSWSSSEPWRAHDSAGRTLAHARPTSELVGVTRSPLSPAPPFRVTRHHRCRVARNHRSRVARDHGIASSRTAARAARPAYRAGHGWKPSKPWNPRRRSRSTRTRSSSAARRRSSSSR